MKLPKLLEGMDGRRELRRRPRRASVPRQLTGGHSLSAQARRLGGRIPVDGSANHSGLFAGIFLNQRSHSPQATAARVLPEVMLIAPIQPTDDADLQAFRETGATGLEPATSGVTGRSWLFRDGRE
jgi:hypothetical protein